MVRVSVVGNVEHGELEGLEGEGRWRISSVTRVAERRRCGGGGGAKTRRAVRRHVVAGAALHTRGVVEGEARARREGDQAVQARQRAHEGHVGAQPARKVVRGHRRGEHIVAHEAVRAHAGVRGVASCGALSSSEEVVIGSSVASGTSGMHAPYAGSRGRPTRESTTLLEL